MASCSRFIFLSCSIWSTSPLPKPEPKRCQDYKGRWDRLQRCALTRFRLPPHRNARDARNIRYAKSHGRRQNRFAMNQVCPKKAGFASSACQMYAQIDGSALPGR